jgi:hypothetical protein
VAQPAPFQIFVPIQVGARCRMKVNLETGLSRKPDQPERRPPAEVQGISAARKSGAKGVRSSSISTVPRKPPMFILICCWEL